MKTTKEQLLRDPDIQPSSDVIAEALGEANNAHMKLTSELASHDIQLAWRYYKDGKAWLGKGLYKWTGVRGGQNEKTVFWISIWDSFFKLAFYIPETSRADVVRLPLDDKVQLMVADSKEMGTKRNYFPLTFDLCSDEMFEAVLSLVDFRKRIQ